MKAVERKYPFSNTKMTEIVGNIVGFLRRDAVEVAVRGVTTLNVDAFEALGNAFEIFPPDGFYQADVTAEVQARDAKRVSSHAQVQLISGFFEQQWGLESWQYKKLLIKGLAQFPDMKFITICRNVESVANGELLNLSGIGLTQADIDLLGTEAQLMEDKLHLVNDATAIRDEKTQERNDDGNALYVELQKFTRIGKLVWENVNEAKFNDYVIHPTVQSGLGKVQNLAGVFIPAFEGAPSRVDLSWSAVTGATEYIVLRSIVPIDLPSATFVDIATVSITQHMDLDMVNAPGNFYYKVRAINLTETGADSDEAKVQVTV